MYKEQNNCLTDKTSTILNETTFLNEKFTEKIPTATSKLG